MNFQEERYRLRCGDKVIGYMRKMAGDAIFYSRDSNWWTGRELDYDEIDEWTGLKDMNGRSVYEWDILHYKIDPEEDYQQGVVLWEASRQEFGIRNIRENIFIPLQVSGVEMFNGRQLRVFSSLFINPDLQRELGL